MRLSFELRFGFNLCSIAVAVAAGVSDGNGFIVARGLGFDWAIWKFVLAFCGWWNWGILLGEGNLEWSWGFAGVLAGIFKIVMVEFVSMLRRSRVVIGVCLR